MKNALIRVLESILEQTEERVPTYIKLPCGAEAPTCTGICTAVGKSQDITILGRELLSRTMESWPEHSGRSMYPVPSPDGHHSLEYSAADRFQMWSKDEPYGASRRRLCRWLISQFKKDECNDPSPNVV